MSNYQINEQFVEQCLNIKNSQDYQQFLAELYHRAQHHPIISYSDNLMEQAKIFLLDATKETPEFTTKDKLSKVLTTDMGDRVIAAASLYLSNCNIEGDTYLQERLLASDSVTAPAISRNAAYYLVNFMGYSGNSQFVPLPHEVLTKSYHFIDQWFVAKALNNLGVEIDEEEVAYKRSIRIPAGNTDILIYTDERYTGSSNCVKCQFFPCRINHYYLGGIQNCGLWNQTDPNTLGNISDRRDWGNEGHLKTQTPEISKQAENTWRQAQYYLSKKLYLKAIPALCASLLSVGTLGSSLKSSTTPLAWLYLSHCFSAYNETTLAFIAIREASKYKNLIPESKINERRLVESYRFEEKILNESANLMQGLNYRKRQQWVKALDCYMNVNICDKTGKGSHWFEMGECHFQLGEYSLAKLFMTMALTFCSDINLQKKFSKRLKQVSDVLSNNKEIGLLIDHRNKERQLIPRRIENGFCLDTYTFEKITERAKEKTKNCRGVKHYFKLAKQSCNVGDFELAVEIMQADINSCLPYAGKAHSLFMIAHIYAEIRNKSKAMQYINWAIEIKPKEEQFRQLKYKIERQ